MYEDGAGGGFCDDGGNGFEDGYIGGGNGSAQGTATNAVAVVVMAGQGTLGRWNPNLRPKDF